MTRNVRTVREGTKVREREIFETATDSIEISRTARGTASFTVKVYGQSVKEIDDKMQMLLLLAKEYAREAEAEESK